jgi:hypothetical protein
MLIASAAQADGPDISAQRVLASWKDADPGMRMVAEVIASAFASTAGKRAYCPSPDLKGGQIISAFEDFLRDNPKDGREAYGAAKAGTLRKSFLCGAH